VDRGGGGEVADRGAVGTQGETHPGQRRQRTGGDHPSCRGEQPGPQPEVFQGAVGGGEPQRCLVLRQCGELGAAALEGGLVVAMQHDDVTAGFPAVQPPQGVTVRMAANHWQLAVDTHNTNHPDTDHACADVSQVDPRYFPSSDILWASPSCTNHSRANGRKRDILQGDLFEQDKLPDEAAERSRATMWDVVRFSEHHQYRAVIVENVVEAAAWLPYPSWLMAMDSLGYEHQIVSLNSMHAQACGLPAPQSRDRLYIVFHRKGNTRPDLQRFQRPRAHCATCGDVTAMQSWKRLGHTGVGRYRQQYVYRCPNVTCRNKVVEPGWLPAASIIDWSIPGQRIGDRDRPLKDKARRRIVVGIARHWSPITLEAAGNTYDATSPHHPGHGDPNSYYRAWSTDDVLRAVHTAASKALAVPVEGRDGKVAQPLGGPLRTQTTRLETAMVCPPLIAELRGGGSTARRASDPLATVTASGNHHALITSYYGHASGATPSTAVLPTVTTVDRHALVMRNNSIKVATAEMITPATEVLLTMTTTGHQSLLTPGDIAAVQAQVDDVLFRMLEPAEVAAAMAFPGTYVLLGNRRARVRLAGAAVTPPAARDLVAAVVDSLEGVAA